MSNCECDLGFMCDVCMDKDPAEQAAEVFGIKYAPEMTLQEVAAKSPKEPISDDEGCEKCGSLDGVNDDCLCEECALDRACYAADLMHDMMKEASYE